MKKAGSVLYWSKRGAIACDAHAPKTDLKRWVDEGWQRVDHSRRPLQCPHCNDDGASVIRTPRRKRRQADGSRDDEVVSWGDRDNLEQEVNSFHGEGD